VGLFERLDALDRRAGAGSSAPRTRSRAERWFTYGLGTVLVGLFLAYGVLLAWNGHHDRRVADRLRHDGIETQGDIIDYRVPYQLKGAHEVKVAFRTDAGEAIQTWVAVSDDTSSGPTRIRYSASDPSVARLADDVEPRAHDLLALIIICLGLGALGFMVYRIGKGFDRRLGVG